MTEGPPSSEATSSKNSDLRPNYTPWHTTITQTSNPYAAHYAPHSYYYPQYQSQPAIGTYPIQPSTSTSNLLFPPSTLKPIRKSPSPPPPSPPPSPPLRDPETYKHWDVVIRAFFLKTGLTQALKGFEADMLVLNPEWEQLKIPLALEEMIKGLTAIMERRTLQTATENEQTGEGQTKDAMQIDGPPQTAAVANSTPLQSKSETSTESLEARKLSYVHLANGAQPRSQSSINKSISRFLAQNQARNNASNRAEFLYSLAERRKRQRVDEAEAGDPSRPTSTDLSEATDSDTVGQKAGTCARVDAKPIDRDAQMKYDIAKDDSGPLSRSAKAGLSAEKGKAKSLPVETEGTKTNMTTTIKKENDEGVTSACHPGLDERLKNIEDHMAVRFVPNPPRTLLARLKFLEDHLINLEKEYPPWAALHFNQPGRGWPPPPRTTPIIVPLHLRDTTSAPSLSGSTLMESTTTPTEAKSPAALGLLAKPSRPNPKTKTRNTTSNRAKSSLHRAVMERLEVQRAMNDLGDHEEAV